MNNPTCRVITASSSYHGKQGFDYLSAVSAQSVGAEHICMHLLTIPPGGKAKAHLHENHETAIYVISGEGAMWYGENLAEQMVARAGDIVYIPAGVPHLPYWLSCASYNPSQSEPVVAVVARTDPNEQESVVLLPELDGIHP